MWSIIAFNALFLLADSSSAQNAYGLKRPSYCSTCFTNDQSQNYYCCFYFFRCCAESRLGSSTRKATTPSAEYPSLQITNHPDKEETVVTEGYLRPPIHDETNSKNCGNPGNQKTDESKRDPGASDVANPCGDEEEETNPSVIVAKVPEKTSQTEDNLRQRNKNNFPIADSERSSVTSYSPASGERIYPYNVRHIYPNQQTVRKTDETKTRNRNDGSLSFPSRTRTRYGGTPSAKHQDSIEDDVQQDGRPGEIKNTGDVIWGRMEPVKR